MDRRQVELLVKAFKDVTKFGVADKRVDGVAEHDDHEGHGRAVNECRDAADDHQHDIQACWETELQQ